MRKKMGCAKKLRNFFDAENSLRVRKKNCGKKKSGISFCGIFLPQNLAENFFRKNLRKISSANACGKFFPQKLAESFFRRNLRKSFFR
jgi:hypothetical protein